MNTHEYQAKEILKEYGMPIPEFGVAGNAAEAEQISSFLGLNEAVVKIQVHAGGRGKAGGVKFAKSKDEIIDTAKKLIGMKMVNNQTGPQGIVAQKVLITEPVDIAKEYYLGAIIDRENKEAILIASPEGGMEIEVVAEKTPEKILKLPIGLDGKVRPYHLLRLANFMGWKGETAKAGMRTAAALAKAFIETDASLLEINPLVETGKGEIWAVDAKLSVDDNALFRQKEIASFYDPMQVSENEVSAKEHDLAYISLEGNIGCMVNGAGLAMSTMDIIHHYGGKPANFLDVGGSADKEKVAAGFKIILADPNVKVILVNIFGGIMNCATIAHGVIAASKEIGMKVPLIVRLEGTNVEEGRKILKESGLAIISAEGMADAAEKSVAALKGGK
ncbi:ADP-forming succinate--CoA ligase subunit beta [Candidatus Neptunochlamydia vexilliferae]|uniref:Succinate--CoA ligase [ADP-forming] subunit beta n=1 Tax=Candidatus Neptunichlamydia vexilliferae TaxID=1651774 RepID=A0ABS0AXF7_9BACT|nr:ADP-forming succinate--CoA ligase subunit beta [Candidatus Neptunochlamydia vexilliferae]MBF5058808.1 Succinyl-CoA ligase [ADP-forming] subunit beta [Candidatus Neptunochlamydia vexilliferae]